MKWPLVELPVNPSPPYVFLEFSNPPTLVASDRGDEEAKSYRLRRSWGSKRGAGKREVKEPDPRWSSFVRLGGVDMLNKHAGDVSPWHTNCMVKLSHLLCTIIWENANQLN